VPPRTGAKEWLNKRRSAAARTVFLNQRQP
jgi:hypothetical protein